MLQHLLNTTAIWLVCLVAYDLLLRRETYHSHNRLYLLLSFIAGFLLPLWEWRNDAAIYTGVLQKPATVMADARQAIETTADIAQAWSWQSYLGLIYIIGATLSALLLIADTVKVGVLYTTGIKTHRGNWKVIETGRPHSPFSVFNLLFVHSTAQYSEEQWNIILLHELQHRNKLHFIDLLFMQLARILFWFHPLVHLYQKRLLMIDEYEADSAMKMPVKDYGQFLVEQALLSKAPSIAHSFNRSPIKKRIVMLTRAQGKYAKGKLLIVLPLLAASIVLFTQRAFSYERKKEGNIITYKGNKIEMSKEYPPDTMMVQDPATGADQMLLVKREPNPEKLNGEKLYNEDDILKGRVQTANADGKTIGQYLGSVLSDFNGVPDGKYNISLSAIIVDRNGKIVFHNYSGLLGEGADKIPVGVQEHIADRVEDALSELQMKPAKYEGKNVDCWLSSNSFSISITIKNGKAIKKEARTW